MTSLVRGMMVLMAMVWMSAPLATVVETEGRQQVLLKERQWLSEHRVYLGDIADFEPADSPMAGELAQVELGAAPRVGAFRHMNALHIAAIVEKQFPGSVAQLRWLGASQVVVGRMGKTYEKTAYVTAAEQCLRRYLDDYGSDVKISLQSDAYGDIDLPKGEVSINAKVAAGKGKRLYHRMAVWVDISVNGEHYRTIPVWFSVTLMREVLVYASSYEKGELLSSVKTRKMKKNIALLSDVVTDDSAMVKQRLSRGVSEGAVVRKTHFSVVPDVVSGSRVDVVAQVGNVLLNTKAIALEEGFSGDRIKVKKEDGLKYSVRVIGKNAVSADGESRL
ncbi:MAG: flagellar basal body P-ring formation chaperone FlgA [Gammaproteobacteria bacterium]|nr:flagellar basal body P-ring formation chaperone FlgA [Gammaproteobacteria bacterium]MDH5800643.1 flagellar basal body P-ring formation chaperone FlgA [Gammaproteobacteria bacterium]